MTDKPYELILLGATGYTGRQAVRAIAHRIATRPLRWAVAGRDAGRLERLVDEGVPAGLPRPGIVVADTGDAGSLDAMAAQTTVLLNFAGPYALSGEAVVRACIANATHHLDLSGETFWVRQMIERHHRAAQAAGVRIVTCCGYEALPFDLAVLWAATRVRERFGAACREVKLIVRFDGPRIRRVQDVVSAGTVASLRSLLEYDTTDSIRNPACLLPPDAPDAAAVARRNAYRAWPRHDADAGGVVGPAVPAPFVNPPVVLRSVALANDPSLFSPTFRYLEATAMASFVPRIPLLPHATTQPLEWAAAAALAAPLAGLGASIAGPLAFQRGLLRRLVERFAPRPGTGPDEAVLEHSGYAFDVFATAADGQRLHGRVQAQGHPGYRSAPEMIVTAGIGLARGELGRTPHTGVVTPAAGLGIAAVDALREAGVRFEIVG